MIDEDRAFAHLKRRILVDRGLDCEQYKENYLKRRVSIRMRATGSSDYMEYSRALKKDPGEYARLLDEITINVTEFFRDRDVFGVIRDHVIPDVVGHRRKSRSRTIRAWSVGCASGEEAYSIAILLDRHVSREEGEWRVRVLGSDLDAGSLEVARAARYKDVGELEGLEVSSYFDVVEGADGDEYRVAERIRRMVKLEMENILEGRVIKGCDLVMCRNVLIYFAKEMQERIVERFAGSLRAGGYLVLGKSETLTAAPAGPFRQVFPRERVYRLERPVRQVRAGTAVGKPPETVSRGRSGR